MKKKWQITNTLTIFSFTIRYKSGTNPLNYALNREKEKQNVMRFKTDASDSNGAVCQETFGGVARHL